MKRLFAILAVVTVAALAWGCAASAGPFRVGKDPAPLGIDQAVVTSLVCEGKPNDARVYVIERGGQDADVTERTERAKAAIAQAKADGKPANLQNCCSGDLCPATK